MSKPNLLSFSSSIGIYRNERILNLREKLSKTIQKDVAFADQAPLLFQVLLAYAAENQHDGDFSGYTDRRWQEIYRFNNIDLSLEEASILRKHFEEVGLTVDGKIRNWAKFNHHLANYEGMVKAKRRAAKLMHKRREREMRDQAKTAPAPPTTPAQTNGKHEKKEISPVARRMSLRNLMEKHPGRPDAANASPDPTTRTIDRAEYKSMKKQADDLDKEIAAGRNPVPG